MIDIMTSSVCREKFKNQMELMNRRIAVLEKDKELVANGGPIVSFPGYKLRFICHLAPAGVKYKGEVPRDYS